MAKMERDRPNSCQQQVLNAPVPGNALSENVLIQEIFRRAAEGFGPVQVPDSGGRVSGAPLPNKEHGEREWSCWSNSWRRAICTKSILLTCSTVFLYLSPHPHVHGDIDTKKGQTRNAKKLTRGKVLRAIGSTLLGHLVHLTVR